MQHYTNVIAGENRKFAVKVVRRRGDATPESGTIDIYSPENAVVFSDTAVVDGMEVYALVDLSSLNEDTIYVAVFTVTMSDTQILKCMGDFIIEQVTS